MTTVANTTVNKLFKVVVREPSNNDRGKRTDFLVLRPSIYYPNYKFVLINTGGAVAK